MGRENEVLMKLRPVAFDYEPEYDDTRARRYGLVAEEAARVAPDSSSLTKEGAPMVILKRILGLSLGLLTVAPMASATDVTGASAFVGITPCRIVDTRASQGFSGEFGPPALAANADRTFQMTGATTGTLTQCGIPDTAVAISVNFTVTGFGGPGDLRVFPAGSVAPLTGILNYSLENIANATTVPLGPSGSGHKGITVHADNFGTHLILDVYGYYATRAAPPCFDDANRYVDCGNGTVTDTVTGLIWLKNANCFSIQAYSAANQAAAGLAAGQCGLTDGSSAGDWRLPTKAEWEATIARAVALGCKWGGAGSPPSLTNDPATDCLSAGPTSFTGVQSSAYWSSQGTDGAPTLAYYVSLVNGTITYVAKVTGNFVWPVRGGK